VHLALFLQGELRIHFSSLCCEMKKLNIHIFNDIIFFLSFEIKTYFAIFTSISGWRCARVATLVVVGACGAIFALIGIEITWQDYVFLGKT
jgi:hypothetical protein